MKFYYLILAAFVAGCAGCNPEGDGPRPNVTTKDDIIMCEPACEHIKSLGCDEGEDLVYPWDCTSTAECADGICVSGKCTETCVMVCEAFVQEGRHLGLECWQTITKCEEIENVCR